MKQIITEELITNYKTHLKENEKSKATIEKYIRDVRRLKDYAKGNEITKELMIAYKEKLYGEDGYKISSVNSYLEVANRFLEYAGWYEFRVKTYKVQQESFCPEERHLVKEEYKKLLKEAKKQGNKRLYLMLETMASTGMRVSELRFITVKSVRSGIVEIQNKGKIRKVLLTKQLQTQLLCYIHEEHRESGPVFLTKAGNPVDRSNTWREMKMLCEGAGVDSEKVFPHNLRKLFASSLYKSQLDIAQVADILGHSSIETTRRYIRETSKEHRKTLEKLDLVEGLW
jgi:site-specific recombinase XerD